MKKDIPENERSDNILKQHNKIDIAKKEIPYTGGNKKPIRPAMNNKKHNAWMPSHFIDLYVE